MNLIEIVNTLLNISRIESGRLAVSPEPTNLRQLIEEVISTLTSSVSEKQQSLSFDYDTTIPQVNTDPKLVKNVYLNLLSNSIKYSPVGGKIAIKVSLSDNNVLSQITDSGLGIPTEDYPRIFEKFFRAKNAATTVSNGTGIGLYLAKAVVESCGGKIWFSSILNQGTSFYFTLPISGSPAKEGLVTLQN